MLIPYEASIRRTRTIVARQFTMGMLYHDWQLALAHLLSVPVPPELLDTLVAIARDSMQDTPFPDRSGPWNRHPVWGKESYGIGHVRSLVRVLNNSEREVPRHEVLINWLRAQQAPDGSFVAHETFERHFRERHPAEAATRDTQTRAAWSHALGTRAPAATTWAHSALEDAWCVIDALNALDARPIDVDGAVRWLQSRQRPDGAFRSELTLTTAGDPYSDALYDTLFAVRALRMLDAAPADRERCIGWLTSLELPWLILPQATRIDALGELRAIDRLRPGMLERWNHVSFSEHEDLLPSAPYEAWVALRAHQWLVGAYDY
jgi:Prenyltransferase and squalene oxidase repeat